MIGQITPETPWEIIRHAKFTASKHWMLQTEPKTKADKEAGKMSATALGYVREKVSEIITGTYRSFDTFATDYGNANEPFAAAQILARYPDFEYFGKNDPVFFDYTEWSGGSPDGIAPNTVFEIKCPENPMNHIEYCDIVDGETLKDIFKECWYQIQFNMACVAKQKGWSFIDMKGVFVSFCPLVNEGFKNYHEAIIEPDHDFYFNLPQVIEKAEAELKNRVLKMKQI